LGCNLFFWTEGIELTEKGTLLPQNAGGAFLGIFFEKRL
jgi:hypothetical protein